MPREVSAVCNSKIETVRALAARERDCVFVTAVKLQNFVLVAALEMLLGVIRDPQMCATTFGGNGMQASFTCLVKHMQAPSQQLLMMFRKSDFFIGHFSS